MKVLILSCNTGGGHNAAGRALYEEFHRRGIDCEFLDTLSFCRPPRFEAGLFDLYQCHDEDSHAVFNWPITLPIRSAPLSRESIVYAFNRKYALKLGQYIEENHFDAIVMPHLFPAEAITYLKKKRNLSVRTYAVATDYTCIPFWEETQPDYFFIPHKENYQENLFALGFPAEKLVPLGIPVQRTFGVRRDQRVGPSRLLGLPTEGRMILFLCLGPA